MIIDRLPADIRPVIEVIDNVERQFRLALMLECRVGKGNLIILSADARKLAATPEGGWLLRSLQDYMQSRDCKPSLELSESQIVNLLTRPSFARTIRELKGEIYNSHWE